MNVNEYIIWAEGYDKDGEHHKAEMLGLSNGKDFKSACKNWVSVYAYKDLYDEENNTYFGCRLFDNEQDARKSFG